VRPSEAKREYFRRLARQEGYLSRAAYKLIQIDDKYKLLKPGFRVLDLGCAPGGWSQVACERVGRTGSVVGVDVSSVNFESENFRFIRADVSSDAEEKLTQLVTKFDCLLSDLSPRMMGVWDADTARQIDLTYSAIRIARRILRKGGSAVLKVFQGEMTDQLIGEVKGLFERTVISKPPASRRQASELYLVCISFKFQQDRVSEVLA
jgi:23S rRNA (uridine2552-2'-O)-methyltransferase